MFVMATTFSLAIGHTFGPIYNITLRLVDCSFPQFTFCLEYRKQNTSKLVSGRRLLPKSKDSKPWGIQGNTHASLMPIQSTWVLYGTD